MQADKKSLIKTLQKDWKKYWFVKLFEEKGFKRRQCKICGNFFWTLTDQTVCNNSTCRSYEFLGNPPTKRKLDYFTTWKTIEKFFVSNGHTSIKRYPTVCRWYPLFFTIAGIVDFYRVVDDKISFEFPANPVILSQPCLRFNDIPQVGVSGKHYTCFDMIQQSSLWDGKQGYWKDKCIDLDFRLLTETFGIKPELINFIEDAWIGYGAFGYSLEYHVNGLELGNAVFTEFEGTLDNYKVMKEKVIDMGAGLNRFCWITQGTSTSYDAVFGTVIERMKDKANIHYDKNFFLNYSKLAGRLDLNEIKDIEKVRANISKQLGVSVDELIKKTKPLEALYAIADHSNALLFAISDGGIPSNVAGGYNLRVILRRALDFIEEFNFPFEIEWVIEEHAKYLKEMYPELLENIEHIKKVLDIEKKKYKETRERIRNIVKVLVKSKTKFTDEKLIELYDSDGITPELLQKTASEHKLTIKIPADFYTKVTERHLQERPKLEEKVKDVYLPQTKKLYYENENLFEFKAKVLKIGNENVVLDQTAFYPRGGGQEPDLGFINNCKVYDVERIGNVIFHKVENPNFKINDFVNCKVDIERRKQITKHHTATHLINGASKRILGKHIWQAGSKKDIGKAHLDITHYENLSEEKIREIEKTVNNAIKKNLKVKKEVLLRDVAEKKYGFVLYQGGFVPEKELRVISVEGFDVEACGGLHVDNTKEIEEVFIFDSKKMQDGIIRLEYVAGKELVEKTKREVELQKKLEKERLKKKEAEILKEKEKLKKVKEKIKLLYGINYIETEDMKELETIGKESIKADQTNYSILIGEGIIFGIKGKDCKIDIENIVKEAAKIMGGSAGGYGNEFKGGGPLKEKSKEAFEKVKKLIK